MNSEKYKHYFKDVSHLEKIDVYAVLRLWCVTCPASAHAIKKLLASGQRGAKDREQDLREAMDSIARAVELDSEMDPGQRGWVEWKGLAESGLRDTDVVEVRFKSGRVWTVQANAADFLAGKKNPDGYRVTHYRVVK